MADDEHPGRSKAPSLESRKNRDPYYGDDPKRIDHERVRADQDRRAFYLIEREAIQLRRRRWEALTKATEMYAREPPRNERSLAQYERPEKTKKQESRLTRLRLLLSRAFRRRHGGADER
jgi:hypothetical protein